MPAEINRENGSTLAARGRACNKHRHHPGAPENVLPLIQPFRAFAPRPDAPPRSWRRPTTCSRARRRARAPRASRGASCTSPSRRSTSIRRPTPTTARSTPRRPRISQRMIAGGVLMRDAKPCYYVYRLTWRGRTQTGLAAVASLADYATNRIRKHELTTPVKEDDRVRQIEAVNAQTGPVMIGYPDAPEIDALLAQAAAGEPDVDVTADDGVRHQLWVIADDATDRRAHARLRCPAGDLHRRRPSPLGGGRARRGSAQGRRLAQLFPVGDLPRTRDDHPRLQSRGEGPQRPQRRATARRAGARASRSPPSDDAGAARRRRTSSACISPAAGTGSTIRPELVPRRSDRPAADHAAHAQRDRAAARHQGPAHRQAHRLRRRRARPGRAREAASTRARWRSPSRSIRRRWPT